MAVQNLKQNLSKTQVKKYPFSYKTEKQNLFDRGEEYSKFINSLPDSPWQKYRNPIYELKKNGVKGLSKNQVAMIHFLAGFFKYGRTCYFKYESIGHRLNIDRKRVAKIIDSLQKREILLKINYKTGNIYGKQQVMLLPNIPSLNKNIQKVLHIKGDKQRETTVESLLLSKYSKSLANFSSLYYMIFKSSIFEKQIIKEQRTSSLFDFCEGQEMFLTESLNPQESKPMRIQLKRKENFASKPLTNLQGNDSTSLRSKFKRGKKHFDMSESTLAEINKTLGEIYNQPCNQRKIPTKTLNKINYLVTHKFGPEYNVESLFKNIKNLESVAGKLENALLFKLFNLLEKDAKLDYINTVKIIHHFNSKKEKNIKFKGLRADKNTREFKKLQLIVSHLMLRGYSGQQICIAIDRAAKYSQYSKLRYCKQISLLPFLVNANNEDYLQVFLNEEDDGAIYSCLNAVKTKYEGIQEGWKEIYIGMYPHPEDGEKYYKRNKNGLIKFAENILENAQNKNFDLCGRHFVKENKYGESAIFQEYITFLQDKFGKEDGVITMKYLVDFTNWTDFVHVKMQGELELYDFFKPIFVPIYNKEC